MNRDKQRRFNTPENEACDQILSDNQAQKEADDDDKVHSDNQMMWNHWNDWNSCIGRGQTSKGSLY